jgi:2-succinyl-5-enolpyruvyl-6-hydroxy-3-cyclohexene-1-carboxylate synthase
MVNASIHNSQFTIHNSQFQNPNIVWAQLFVNALAGAGLTAVCIAPGSRSTPLTLAFDAHPEIEVFVHLDERSAGFFALGMAIASDKPVALVCTSGTAVANFLPAIVEAKMSQVPLLVLTADRPHELRHSGANQTIDQVKIFGDQVLWSVDLPVPQADVPELATRNLWTTAARAYATANGLTKGPVHLNFPFRAPLEPVRSEQLAVSSEQSTHYALRTTHGRITLAEPQLDELATIIKNHHRGLIVCGPRCPDGEFPQAIMALAQQTGYPILADPISGLRFFQHVDAEKKPADFIISGYETFLQGDPGWPEPQVILRFGAVPISKWLNVYLDKIRPAHRIHIRENGMWADDSHRTTHFIQANETAVCQHLLTRLPQRENVEWVTAVTQTDQRTWQALENALYEPYFDGAVVADVLDLIPPEATLFMGNSLPIRHLDQYGRAQAKPLFAYANRGASGIDGNLSTALGIHAIRQQPLVAVVGDITFYHDMNGLLQVASGKWASGKWQVASGQVASDDLQPATCNLPLVIVLLNNNGGGIFNRLPVANLDPPFTNLFLTPHGLDFEPAVRMYGLDFVRVNGERCGSHTAASGRAQFRQQFTISLQSNTPRVIEVRTDGKQDDARRREINQIVNREL